MIESLCVIIAESYGHLGFEGLISFREHLLALQGAVRAVNSEYQGPSFNAIPPFLQPAYLTGSPEAEVDVRERRNPPLETEFFTISGPFLALLPKVNI